MIDPQLFRALLLLVCVGALIAAGMLFTVTFNTVRAWYKQAAFNVFCWLLGMSAAVALVLLSLLK